MDEFDGRGLALGIIGGVIVGFGLLMLTDNAVWVGLIAGIGAILGLNKGWFSR